MLMNKINKIELTYILENELYNTLNLNYDDVDVDNIVDIIINSINKFNNKFNKDLKYDDIFLNVDLNNIIKDLILNYVELYDVIYCYNENNELINVTSLFKENNNVNIYYYGILYIINNSSIKLNDDHDIFIFKINNNNEYFKLTFFNDYNNYDLIYNKYELIELFINNIDDIVDDIIVDIEYELNDI